MRKASVVGPLLLILIGALFLIHNLRPEFSVWRIISSYWPYVLIAWGALRGLEIFIWWLRRRPLPAAGLSGGEWAVAILITVVGSGLYVAHRHSFWWPHVRIAGRGLEVFGETFDYPLDSRQAVGKDARVIIENLRGSTRIIAADAPEVRVSGRKTIRSFDRPGADSAHRNTPLEIKVQGSQVNIRTNQERAGIEQRITADLEITVPRGASIEWRTRLGDLDVMDLQGNVDVDADNAGVRLQNIGGNVRVDARRSDIIRVINLKGTLDAKSRGQDVELENIEGQVTIGGSYSGEMQFRRLAKPLRYEGVQSELRLERLPGQLQMDRSRLNGENVVGPIRVVGKSRDVQLIDFTQALEIAVDRGDIDLRPERLPLARIDARTNAGYIELALPPSANFELKASTAKGEAQNDYGAPLKVDSHGRGATIAGNTGQGPALKLVTERGTVTIRKASASDLPARVTERPGRPPRPPLPAEPPLRVERQ